MMSEIAIEKVYLAQGATDLRKSIDGLAAIVNEEFELDLFSSCLFVFCNRSRDKLKILVWEHNGFWLTIVDWKRERFTGQLSIGVCHLLYQDDN
ncbi:IS66 family insertion sequence element accessory protein TnpB [Bacillus bingmayongensis]|uniref:IS66 family insertion sequence element accessory protein TnpB n=1 Tax=Bacillus bingmayongensis TaxID=1150157 RepID=UPI001C8E6B3B|nr:IS66 family insertion sequence element accessory protein TnpB [Bacillus bingmayongensis]MBY0600460.1 IS66 family insertion sequence element accessory protein TnpB [Bacillus bingmayongensis]